MQNEHQPPRLNPVLNFFQTLSGRKFFTRGKVHRIYTRAGRHENTNIKALRKRRAKTKAGRKMHVQNLRRAKK